MRKLITAFALLFGLASAASAQSVDMPPPAGTIAILCAYNSVPPVMLAGKVGYAQCDAAGNLLTSGGGSGGTASQVQGNVASGAADVGNPVKVGGVFNTTPPTFTNGQRGDLQISANGSLRSELRMPGSTSAVGTVNGSGDTVANTSVAGYIAGSFGWVYNGTTWDRQRSASADAQSNTGLTAATNMLFNGTNWDRQRSIGAGNGIAAVAIAPTALIGGALTPVVSPAAENSRVLKASAGNLYSVFAANHTATPGFLLILNATAAPADGAVTPLECAALPANGNATVSYNPGPASNYSTGITAVLSSGANCFTKTTGVITGFIRGSVQ